ncbi:CARDB domain protein [Leptospira santarosai str. CBC1416]|uniref:CARDB domain protein n=1 Tax=Leptospira santarosai str. CBC1416 TaxID=1193059 RepID=M6VNG8_9LEPT|nr:CARDB domain protein [Leptospira santarosai str. CBC1416]
MKEFLRKTIAGTITLLILCLTLYCGGGKDIDNSALLLLLSPQQSSGVNGLTDATPETDVFVVSTFEDLNVGQGESDLVLLDPNLKAWTDLTDHNQCVVHFTLKIKNRGNGVFNPYSRFAASVESKTNVKHGVQMGHLLGSLRPGEIKDLSFVSKYSIEDIEDPNGVLKIQAEFFGITDGSKTDNRVAFVSTSDCKAKPTESGSPDLIVSLNGVTEVKPGEDVSQKLKVEVSNVGGSLANGSRPGNEGYMVDLILSKDTIVPEGYAVYSPDYKEDGLLGGGRIGNTPDLAAGAHVFVSEGSNFIPNNVPSGNYFLCARVDAGSKVVESNERNNTTCVPISVRSNEPQPDLIIPRASIYPSGMKCRAGKPMMYITAEVKNIGKAPSSQNLNVGLINALDTNGERWGKGNGVWGNGIGLESVKPGETVTVTFPIYYLVAEPSYMEGKHTFDLKVNRGNWIEESDLKNNGYRKLLEITIPEGYCESHPG